ncbi:hypothetical protein RSOLAG22IIIB_03301 [Rhizoctonia solani]|uniref:Uncharacterized protein n=1 Tax=Rhizoctonia solani TaxID=456999 RepID=A0A0K6FPH4_9AGAM|nr:hypothetical protein RSOLAG22IIIB_03301 [Rhizoctonia solani]
MFDLLPSSSPPGSSHYISDKLIIAKRIALGFEDPVRIQWTKWGKGNPFFDWQERHELRTVKVMQLRKEQKAPFFHEYVTFKLNDGTCFRIDRRQVPDEDSPMSCTKEQGVEAYDTLEQVSCLDDSTYSVSDCLIELSFEYPVSVVGVTTICYWISRHSKAHIYTLQKYNCYFYAQTIVLLTSCDWDGDDIWWTNDSHKANLRSLHNWEVTERQRGSRPAKALDPAQPSGTLQLPTELAQRLKARVKAVLHGRERPQSTQQGHNMNDLREYVAAMIQAHSIRVAQYKFLLRYDAGEVERDIKTVMNDLSHVMKGFMWDLGIHSNHNY